MFYAMVFALELNLNPPDTSTRMKKSLDSSNPYTPVMHNDNVYYRMIHHTATVMTAIKQGQAGRHRRFRIKNDSSIILKAE